VVIAVWLACRLVPAGLSFLPRECRVTKSESSEKEKQIAATRISSLSPARPPVDLLAEHVLFSLYLVRKLNERRKKRIIGSIDRFCAEKAKNGFMSRDQLGAYGIHEENKC
jgi:hypothetical protein